MVDEGWTLNDVIAFSEEHKLNLTIYDSTNNVIPKEKYTEYKDIKVISQSRPVGDEIINGFNFYVNINTQYTNNTEGNEETTEIPEISE